MPKTKLICFWWLKSHNLKIIVENLSINLKIGVIKILILMAIKSNDIYNELQVSSKELSLDVKTMAMSLCWLSKNKVIVLIDEEIFNSDGLYSVKYTDQEQELRDLYDEYWVELPNQKILEVLKRTPNDECVTFETLINYLLLIKGLKKEKVKYKLLYFDEEFIEGFCKGTWREVLVKYKLVEFWEYKVNLIGLNNS